MRIHPDAKSPNRFGLSFSFSSPLSLTLSISRILSSSLTTERSLQMECPIHSVRPSITVADGGPLSRFVRALSLPCALSPVRADERAGRMERVRERAKALCPPSDLFMLPGSPSQRRGVESRLKMGLDFLLPRILNQKYTSYSYVDSYNNIYFFLYGPTLQLFKQQKSLDKFVLKLIHSVFFVSEMKRR